MAKAGHVFLPKNRGYDISSLNTGNDSPTTFESDIKVKN